MSDTNTGFDTPERRRQLFDTGRSIAAVRNGQNRIRKSFENGLERRMDPFRIAPDRLLVKDRPVFLAPVDSLRPRRVVQQPFQEMIEIQVIDADAFRVEIGCVDIDQIRPGLELEGVPLETTVPMPVRKNRLIALKRKVAEMRFERHIPGNLVSESPFDRPRTHVQVGAVKQVVGPLDDARLK